MFNKCSVCDNTLIAENGLVYGYWGEVVVKFINLPRLQCSNIECGEFYLNENVAIVTQEITRALYDIDKKATVIDISESIDVFINHISEIYEIIVEKKICLTEINGKIIINAKDIESLFYSEQVLLAARNNHIITDDVKKEIDCILEKK